MIHKVKYGFMKVVREDSLITERAPDLTFKGSSEHTFAVFFAPFGSIEAEEMRKDSFDYYAPFEAEYSDEEAEAILSKEGDYRDDATV